jgi:predicted protein tyrosine phosphatase
MSKLTQTDFRKFEKALNAVRRENKEERKDATGLLTPSLIQKHLKSGKPLVLPYGKGGKTVTYSVEELKAFQRAAVRVKRVEKSSVQGVPLLRLEQASHMADKERVQQIKNAMLYRIRGNNLNFQVTASGKNGKQHHQVRIRLEEWYDHMTAAQGYTHAAKRAAVGRISFECSCGRHQYWYRYLATVSNCALTPKETDFPKIRNPKLEGFCCKHVLKVFQQLKSPSVHALLAKQMQLQADSAGYTDQASTKFLTAKELQQMKRAKGSEKDSKDAKDAYRQFRKAKTAIGKKVGDKTMRKEYKKLLQNMDARIAENKALKKRAQKAEAKVKREAIVNKMRGFLDAMDSIGVGRDEALVKFADKNGLTGADVEAIAKEYSL